MPSNTPSYPAGFWIRVLASFIDGMVFLPTVAILFLDLIYWKNFFVIVLICLPSFIYKPFMESLKGATLGKMACGLRVIDENGGNLTLGRAYLRSLPNLAALIVAMVSYALLFANPAFIEARSFMEFISLPQPNELAGATFIINLFVLVDGLVVAFTAQKRAIHDYLAGSYCVRAGSANAPIHAMAQRTMAVARSEGSAEENAFYCSNCDAEISPDALYCPKCGTKFE